MNTTITVVGWVGERDEHNYQSSCMGGGDRWTKQSKKLGGWGREMNQTIKVVVWVGERDEQNYQRSWVGGGERWTQLSK